MERRSARIQQRRERLAERQEPEEEEHVAPPPRGRQNRGRQPNHGRHNQRHGHEQSQGNNIPIIEEVHEEDEEVEQNDANNPVEGEEPPPPPPTLAEVMDRQTRLLENLARRQENGNGQGKMAAFMRLHPPTFDSSEDDPLVPDD